MGVIVKLSDVVFTDNTLPKLYPDALMNAGSLYLVDFTNPNGYDGGITPPANTTLIPNIAWETAKAIIGSGDRTSLSSTALVNFSGGESIIEFTPKKGLHVITSQVALANNHAFFVSLPTALRTYLMANFSHKYYFSAWAANTRLALTANTGFFALGNVNPSFTANNLMTMQRDTTLPGGAARIGSRNTAYNTLGTFFRNIATNAFTGTVPASLGDFAAFWKVGSGSSFSSFEVNSAASMIIYRIYIEDLNVSGKTYAEVDAADYALYQAAFASGGRFNGDTFTAPSTLP